MAERGRAGGPPGGHSHASGLPERADGAVSAGGPGGAVAPGRGPGPEAESAAARLAEITGAARHEVAIVLGSGWRPAAEMISAAGGDTVDVPFAELGGFPPTDVSGHTPAARSVLLGGRRVLLFLGRVHPYEGHDLSRVVHNVRTARAAGSRTVILTNAAGGLRSDMYVGQPVLIADHLNLTGRSPLVGPLFTDLTDAYSPRLRSLARGIEPGLAEGVYAAMPGPNYETPAEIRMLRGLGADLVGMSTVHETIAARTLGMEVLAVSLVSNLAAGMTSKPLNHAEVLAAGAAAAGRVGELLAKLVAAL